MRKLILIIAILIMPLASFASHWVNDYTRSDGTYVQGHMSMDPDESKSTGLSYHHNQIVPRRDYSDDNSSFDSNSDVNNQSNTDNSNSDDDWSSDDQNNDHDNY